MHVKLENFSGGNVILNFRKIYNPTIRYIFADLYCGLVIRNRPVFAVGLLVTYGHGHSTPTRQCIQHFTQNNFIINNRPTDTLIRKTLLSDG